MGTDYFICTHLNGTNCFSWFKIAEQFRFFKNNKPEKLLCSRKMMPGPDHEPELWRAGRASGAWKAGRVMKAGRAHGALTAAEVLVAQVNHGQFKDDICRAFGKITAFFFFFLVECNADSYVCNDIFGFYDAEYDIVI
jgi:hypothetical protein